MTVFQSSQKREYHHCHLPVLSHELAAVVSGSYGKEIALLSSPLYLRCHCSSLQQKPFSADTISCLLHNHINIREDGIFSRGRVHNYVSVSNSPDRPAAQSLGGCFLPWQTLNNTICAALVYFVLGCSCGENYILSPEKYSATISAKGSLSPPMSLTMCTMLSMAVQRKYGGEQRKERKVKKLMYLY